MKFTILLYFCSGVNMSIVKIIQSYLSNRKFDVKSCGKKSTLTEVRASLPQSGILFSTLYNIYTADMPALIDVNKITFVDDTMIYSTTAEPRKCRQVLQNAIKKTPTILRGLEVADDP